MIEIIQPCALPAAVVRIQAQDRLNELIRSPKAARRRQIREENIQRDQMSHTLDIQRDYVRWCGIPLGFTAVEAYGVGASPLTFPSAGTLASWHLSTRGVTLGAQLIPTVGTDPAVSFSSNINQSVPARMDIILGGIRGVSTYGLTIDGGLSYFQTGLTATSVNVPAFGQAMTMNSGLYTALNTYAFVVVSMANQTPLARTLAGATGVTDANRPRILPNVLNGYPSIKGNGGTLGGLVDTTSSWASDVCSGTAKDFTWIFVMADDTATPSSAVPFMSFSDNVSAIPLYAFTVRNGTNVYRCQHVTDANASTLREAGTLDVAFHTFVVMQSAGLCFAWVDGVNIVNGLSWGAATLTTCTNVGLFCTNRGNAQAGTNRFQYVEGVTYTNALPTSQWQQVATGYLKGKYNTP